jgi:hypothetical protein
MGDPDRDEALQSAAETAIDQAVKEIFMLDLGVTDIQIRRALRRAASPPADTGPFACVLGRKRHVA